jgi:hypothetical protein
MTYAMLLPASVLRVACVFSQSQGARKEKGKSSAHTQNTPMKEEIRNKLSELIEMVPLEDLVFFKSVVNKAIDARVQQSSILTHANDKHAHIAFLKRTP